MLLSLMYWSMAWVQMSGRGINDPSNTRVFVSIIVYVIGVSIMLISDS